MMTTDEIVSVLNLIEKLDESNSNHDVITAIIEFLKGANPYSLTCDKIIDLEGVVDDLLDNVGYWDNNKGKLVLSEVLEGKSESHPPGEEDARADPDH